MSAARNQDIFSTFTGICKSGLQAESMTTYELTTALAELRLEGGEHVASIESAVKGEAIHRLNRPLTWRLRRWSDRMKRHANQI